MFVSDALTLDAPRRTSDGYMAVRAKAARTGVYQYTGREVDPENAHGLRDTPMVNVLRDDAAVFAEKSVRSFIGKPITNDHPTEPVTSKNWKKHADGVIMGAIRDGDHLAFDLLLMDAQAIADTEAGKVQLSNGYDAKLEFGRFVATDGTVCQARQDEITGNHVARVDLGRAGETCAIPRLAHCDAAPAALLDSLTKEKPVKTMLIDGLTVDIANADTAEATIKTLLAARDAATAKATTAEATIVTRDATIVSKDAEIVKLKQDVADAKVTPQMLRDAGKSFAIVTAKAKALGVTVTDAMDEPAIMKAVVDKAMPGNTYTADHVAIAFAALTKDAKIDDARDPLRDAITAQPVNVGDAASREAAALAKANNQNAWRTAGAA